MFMSYDDWKPLITFVAEVCEKQPPSDKKMKWYHEQVKQVEVGELKRALNTFAVRMKWPSAKELLQECGIHVALTRDEQARADSKVEEDAPTREDPLHHLNSFGFWCFLSEIETNSEAEGKAKLETKSQELAGRGWNIWWQEDYRAKRQIKVGNQSHDRRVQCRKNWAFRFEGEPNPVRDLAYMTFLKRNPTCAQIAGVHQNEANH